MIAFMVIGAPRSGTTWAANWLTTDNSLCLHDPLAMRHYSEWDGIKSSKRLGISDTGISAFPDWLNLHPAPKVILHRNRNEIALSLGITEFMDTPCRLIEIHGMHVDYLDLWNNPKPIYEFLLEQEFDTERHAELMKMNIQPHGNHLKFDTSVVRRVMDEMRGSAHA